MQNTKGNWDIVKKPSRPSLTKQDVVYWRRIIPQTAKVGIELEYNLKEQKGFCNQDNFMCKCTALFHPENPQPKTSMCYQQCRKWDNGNCSIAKEYGCAGVNCVEFDSPCPSCSKYDRGCSTCPDLNDPTKNPQAVRDRIKEELQPTNFVGKYGKKGVFKVLQDGSLLGDKGIEIATVGRRVQFTAIHSMLKEHIAACTEKGAYTNERCSVHVHLLLSYLTPEFDEDNTREYISQGISELEKPVPEIILANFHQLFRRYHNAFIWMSSTGKSRDTLTRWEKFRKPILNYSALRNRMPRVINDIMSSAHKRRYAVINYKPIKFNDNGDIDCFHLEARYMDGNISPAAIAAQACLLYGLLLKAVEISRWGLIEAGNHEYMEAQKEVYSRLCNNSGDWGGSRHSDTSNLDPHIPKLIEQSKELVELTRSALLDDKPASDILSALAERPISIRLSDGDSWKKIEADLIGIEKEDSNDTVDSLNQLISMAMICDCDDPEEWIKIATHQIAEDSEVLLNDKVLEGIESQVRTHIKTMSNSAHLLWESSVGTFIARN